MCQLGGKIVTIAGIGSGTSKYDQTYPGATVTVYSSDGVSLATIYSDNGITPKANPFTSDSTTAAFFFYAANGVYSAKCSGAGIASPITVAGFLLNDYTDPLNPVNITGGTIAGVTIDNSIIGGTTPAAATFTTTLTKNLNSVRYASQFSGASTNAKVTAAMADCPTTGCTVYSPDGTVTFVGTVTFPSDRPIVLHLGAGTLTGPCPLFDMGTASDGSQLLGISAGDPSQSGATYGTKLVCSSGTPAIKIGTGSPRLNAIAIDSLDINCNSVSSSNAITIDTVEYSRFTNLTIGNCLGSAIKKQVTNTTANVNNYKNYFANIGAPTGNASIIDLEGNTTGGGNNTQEVYINIAGSFTSNNGGIICNACDNETFVGLRASRTSGSGYGLVFGSGSGSVAPAAYNNVFSYTGGVGSISDIQAQSGTVGNKIYGFDRTNGELAPVLAASSELIVDGSVLCGTGSCPGPTGVHPTPWLMAQGNAGNAPTSNPTNLNSGLGMAWNYSNGGGEADFLINIGPGGGGSGLARFYSWNGSAATLYASLPNGVIGDILGTTGNQSITNKTFTDQIRSTLATGTAPLSVTSITPVTNLVVAKHPLVYDCGTTSTCSATQRTGEWITRGSVALVSASPSAATITGFSPAYTSTATYTCTAVPEGNTAAIAAAGIAVTKVSASSITLTGPNTVTTVVDYECLGH